MVTTVLESAERIWQLLNPPSVEEHCRVSASVTSDNCQLVLQLCPFRAADNTGSLLHVMVWSTKLTCRWSGNKNRPRSNRTRQISTGSHMRKTPNSDREALFSFSLCPVFVFYSIHSRMQQPSLSLKPSVATLHPYIKLSG